MPVLTPQQQAELVGWRRALQALYTQASAADEFLRRLQQIDETPLLAGKVTWEWADIGDSWNDLRDKMKDAAEAMPVHED